MKKPALIMIDVQKGFNEPSWGPRNNPEFEKNTERLLAHWRAAGGAVYHVQHLSRNPKSPLHPSSSGVGFQEIALPRDGEPVIQKHVNSAFIGTELEHRLRLAGHERVVIAGLATDHCVSTTTRMAANLGFEVFLSSDATATHDRRGFNGEHFKADAVHAITLASLHGEFATVLPTAELLGLVNG